MVDHLTYIIFIIRILKECLTKPFIQSKREKIFPRSFPPSSNPPSFFCCNFCWSHSGVKSFHELFLPPLHKPCTSSVYLQIFSVVIFKTFLFCLSSKEFRGSRPCSPFPIWFSQWPCMVNEAETEWLAMAIQWASWQQENLNLVSLFLIQHSDYGASLAPVTNILPPPFFPL